MTDKPGNKTTAQVEAELAGVLQAIAFTYADGRRPSEDERNTIRRIGGELNDLGGTALMKEVFDRVLKPHFEYYERLVNICDKNWSGIGDWLA
jgi:hypothetical protein